MKVAAANECGIKQECAEMEAEADAEPSLPSFHGNIVGNSCGWRLSVHRRGLSIQCFHHRHFRHKIPEFNCQIKPKLKPHFQTVSDRMTVISGSLGSILGVYAISSSDAA
jgi:hypothetical protein